MERLEDTIQWADKIADAFADYFGGATTYFGEGQWKSDAHKYADMYLGERMKEDCAVIEVVTTKKLDLFIQSIIKNRATRKNEGQWVHMERERIKCNHFQINV